MSTAPLTLSESMQDAAWRISGLSLVLGLLLWGWFALTLSPIQRYYFSAYVGSSLHRIGSHEQDRAVWILKAKPTNTFVVADPQDLVPAEHGPVPFALSKSAQAEGWTGTDVSPLNSYPAGSQRLFLRKDYFGGRSLFELLSPPLQLLAVPLAVCFAFVFWKRQRDEERRRAFVWAHEETSWSEDALAFSRDMAEASRFVAVSGWRWTQAQRGTVKKWRERGSVSPSAPETEVHVPQSPTAQPVKAEQGLTPKLSRAQTLPFRKRQATEGSETEPR